MGSLSPLIHNGLKSFSLYKGKVKELFPLYIRDYFSLEKSGSWRFSCIDRVPSFFLLIRQGLVLHLMKEPLVTDERRNQVCFGVTTLSTLNKCCGLSAIFALWKTLRSLVITGKSSAIKPVADGLGIPVASCRQAELALADL